MPDPARDLEGLLAFLRDARGFDFTGYKVASLERRLRRRMDTIHIGTYDEYREHLEVHPDEFQQLFNTILINVTSFFRDREAWDFIVSDVVPGILEARGEDEPIRVWSAGCASGEETYSAAIVLAAALGEEAFLHRVKIYGTDVDDEALDHARAGLYGQDQLEAVPDDLRDGWLQPAGDRWCLRKDLRRSVIFGRNNLVEDAPISRIDLLLCRNTLMYFTSETQSHILRRLHFGLRPTGFLFLGRSETLLTRRELFEPVDLRRRIFTKVERPGDRRRPPLLMPVDDDGLGRRREDFAARTLDAAPGAHLVVAADRTLLLASEGARRLLRVRAPDIGRPLQDLEASYRPAELRPSLDVAFAERRVVSMDPVRHRHGDEELALQVTITPLVDGEVVDAVGIVFTDVTGERRAQQELERSRQELGSAYEELQSTVEELETTNEELQSTNEELETTNEELQSANEELETMNEELQSTNEELETSNEELRQRSFDLRESNAVMEAILRSRGVGVIVIDRARHVRLWSDHSEELWGLRADEAVGMDVFELDSGFPLEAVRSAVDAALTHGEHAAAVVVPATDRRGRAFRCRLGVVPLVFDGNDATAAIVLTERAAEGES